MQITYYKKIQAFYSNITENRHLLDWNFNSMISTKGGYLFDQLIYFKVNCRVLLVSMNLCWNLISLYKAIN